MLCLLIVSCVCTWDSTLHTVIGTESALLREAVTAIALCHNVTPAEEDGVHSYQASSPDEVALVRFAESVGMRLEARSLTTITLCDPLARPVVCFQECTFRIPNDATTAQEYEILHIFPFTSVAKRMGIIVRELTSGAITFLVKGADTVMAEMVQYNDWLEEECGNMAREVRAPRVFLLARARSLCFIQFVPVIIHVERSSLSECLAGSADSCLCKTHIVRGGVYIVLIAVCLLAL